MVIFNGYVLLPEGMSKIAKSPCGTKQYVNFLPSHHYREAVDSRPRVLHFREVPNVSNVLPFAEEFPAMPPMQEGISSGFEVSELILGICFGIDII